MSMQKLSVISFIILTVFSSCRKERDTEDFQTVSDNALAENSFNELKNIADEAYSGNMVIYRSAMDTLVYGCATVIRDTTGNGGTITVDFGTSNCQCNDGKNRRGKVIFTYTGPYRDSGTVITHTPDQYFVNDNQLTGTKTVTNMGRNNAGNLWYAIHVDGTVIKANNGGTITWVSDRTREWVAGESTVLNIFDDAYLISGTGNGVAANGESFTAQIITPLRKEIGCYHFVSGSISITPESRPTRVIDYGNGTCDNNATVTVNGNTYSIQLP